MKKIIVLYLLLLSQLTHSQTFDVDTLQWLGEADKRINLVIMGDGYQVSEQDRFILNANNFIDALFNETPYKEYQNYFNVFAIKVPSNESGVSHPGTATDVSEPVHPVSTVDNYFGSTFDYAGIHRLIVATKTLAITNVLAVNFPMYDQAFILANSPYYGGSGGAFPTASLAASSDEIAIHELGHSFVYLKDEYYAGDVFAAEGINMTQETDPNNVKWKNWMNDNGIGIYQYCCGGNSASWYRPHQDCKMRYLGRPFCSVCIEGTIERIHALVGPIDAYTPENTGLVSISDSMMFTLNLIHPSPNTLKVEWGLNGNIIGNNVDSLNVQLAALIPGPNQLTATVQDTTSYLRIDNHETIHLYTVDWSIDGVTTNIDKITENEFTIRLAPNPIEDILFVQFLDEISKPHSIEFTDLSGKQFIYKEARDAAVSIEIDVSTLPAGVFIATFRFEDGASFSKKLVKR